MGYGKFNDSLVHYFTLDPSGTWTTPLANASSPSSIARIYNNSVLAPYTSPTWTFDGSSSTSFKVYAMPLFNPTGTITAGVVMTRIEGNAPTYDLCLRNSYAPTTARLLATVAASTLPSRQTTWAQFSAIVTQLTSVYFSSDTGYGVSTGMSTPTGDYFGLRDCRAPSNAMDAICRVVIAQGHSILAELVSQPYFGDMKRHAYIVDDVTGLLSTTSVGMYPSDFIPASQPWYMQAVSMGQGWSGYYPFVDSSVVGITYAIPVYNSSGNLVSVISADYTNQEPCYDPTAWNSYTISASSAGASKFGAWPASPSDAAAVSIFRSGPTSVSDIAVVIKSLWSTWQSTQQGDSRLITLADTSANSYGVRDCYSADNALLSVCRVYGPSARALAIVTSPSVFGNVYRHNFMIDIAGNMNMTELALGMSTAVYNATTRPWYQNAVLYGTGLSPWYSSAATAAPIRSFSVPVWDGLGVNMLGVVSSDEALAVRLPVYNKCLRNSYAPTTARLLAAVAASTLPSRQTTWSQFSAIVTQLTSVYFSSDTGYGVSTGMSTPTGDYFGLRDCRAPSNAMDAICRVVIAQGHSILAELVSQPYFGDMKRHAYIVDDVTGLLSATSVGMYPSDFIPASQSWYMQAVSMGQGWSGYYPFVDSSVVGITYAIPVYNSSGNLVSVISADYTNQEPCYDPLAWNSYIVSASTSGASKFGAWPASPSDAAAVSIFRTGPTSVSDIAVVIKSLWRLWQATQDGYSSLLSLADTSANVYGVRDCYSADKSVLAVCRVYGPSARAVAVVTAPSVFGNVFRHNFAIDMTGRMNLTELSVGMSTAVYNATTRPWYQNAVSNGIGVTAWFLSSGTTIPIRSFSVPVWDSLGVNMLGVMSSDEALMSRMPVYNKCLRNSYAPTTARLLASVAASTLPSRQTTWAQFSAIVTQLTSVYFSSDTGYGVSTGMSTPTGDYFGLRDCRAPSNAMDAICRVVIAQGHSILAELVSQPYFGDMKRHAYIVDDVTGLLSSTSVGMYPSDFIPASQPWYMQAVSMGQGWSGYYAFVDSSVVGITYAIPVYNSSGNLVSVISADYTNQEPCYDPTAWNSYTSSASSAGASKFGAWPASPSDAAAVSIFRTGPTSVSDIAVVIKSLWSTWQSTQQGDSRLITLADTSANSYGVRDCYSADNALLSVCRVYGPSARALAIVTSPSVFGNVYRHNFMIDIAGNMNMTELALGMSTAVYNATTRPWYQNAVLYGTGLSPWYSSAATAAPIRSFSVPVWDSLGVNMLGVVSSDEALAVRLPVYNKCLRNSYAPTTARLLAAVAASTLPSRQTTWSQFSAIVTQLTSVYFSSDTGYGVSTGMSTPTGDYFGLRDCRAPSNAMDAICRVVIAQGHSILAELVSQPYFGDMKRHAYIVDDVTGLLSTTSVGMYPSDFIPASQPWYMQAVSMGQGWSGYYPFVDSSVVGITYAIPVYNSSGNLVSVISADYTNQEPCYDPLAWNSYIVSASTSGASKFGAWPASPSDAAAVSIFRSGPTSVSDIAVVIKSLWRLWQATQDGYSSLLSLADTSANVYGVRDCYSADKSVLAVCRVYGPSTRAVAVVTAPSVFGNVFRHNFAIDMTGRMNLTELSVGMSTAVYNATTRPWYQNAVSNGIGVTAWFLSSGTTIPIRSFSVPVWDSLGVNMLGVMSSDEALMSRMPVYNKCLRNSYAPTTARLLATVAASTLPSRQTTWSQFSAIVTQLTSVYFSSDTGYGVSTGMSTPTGDYFGLRDCRAPSNAMDAICRVVIAQGHSILAELVSQPYFGDMKRHAYIVDDVTGLLSTTSVGIYPSDFIPASQPWYMQAVSMGQGWSGYYPFVDSSVVGITYAIPVYNSSGNLVSVISADYTNQEPCYDPLAWNSYIISASTSGASKFGAWPASPSDAAAVSIFRSGPASVSDIAVVIKSLWSTWQSTQQGDSRLITLADTSANSYGVRDCYSADNALLSVCRVYGPSARALAIVTSPSVFGNVYRHNFMIDIAGNMNMTELALGMSTAVYNATTRPWYQNAVLYGTGLSPWYSSAATAAPIRSFSVPVWDSLGVNMLGVVSSDEALAVRLPVYNKCLRNSYAPTTARLLAAVAASTLPSRQTTWSQFSAIVTQLTSVYFSSDTGYGVSTGMSTPTGDFFGLRDCRAPSNAMDAICRVVIAQGHSILAELVSQPYFGDMKRHAYIVDDVTGLLSSTSVGMYPSDFIPASQPWYMQAVSMGQGWSGYYAFVDSSVVGITYAIPVYNSSGNLVSVISADYTNQEPCYDPLAWNSYTITASSAGASKFGAWPASPSDAAAVSIFRSSPTSVSDIAVVIKSLWRLWQATQDGYSSLLSLADTSANVYGVRDCYSADKSVLAVCRVYGPSTRAVAVVTAPSVFGNVFRHNFAIDMTGKMNLTELSVGMSTAVYNATTRPWYQNAVSNGIGVTAWFLSSGTTVPIRSFSVPVWDSLGVNMLGVMSSDEALMSRMPVYNKCLRNSYAPTTARLLATVAASTLPSRQTTWSQFSAIVTQLTSVYFSSDTGYGVSTGMSTPTGDYFGLRDCRAPSNAMDAICRVVIAQGHSILAELVSQPYFGDMKRHAYIVDDVTGLLSSTSVGMYPSDFIPASQPWYMQAVSMGQGWSGYYPFVDSSVVGITYAIPVYNSSGNLVSVISADYTNQEPCYDPLAWNSYTITASSAGASKFGAWPASPSDAAAVSIFRTGPTSVSDIAVVIKSLWSTWQSTQQGDSRLITLADTSANSYGVRDCYSADNALLSVCRVYGPSARALAIVTSPSVFGNVYRHNFMIDIAGNMNMTELALGMSTAVYNATTRPWYQNAVLYGTGVSPWYSSAATAAPIRSFSVPVWDSLGVNMLGVVSSDEALAVRLPVYNKCLRNSYAPTTARLLAAVAASTLPSRQTTWSQFSAIVTQLTSVYFSSGTGYGVSTGMSTPTGDYFGLRDCRAPSNAMDAICRVVIAQGHSILAELVSQPYFGDMKRHAYIVDDVTGLLSTTSVGMYPSDFIPASQPWYMQAVSMGQGWSGYYPFVDSSVVGITYAIPVYNSSGNLVSVISADYTNQEPCYDPLAWNSYIVSASTSGASKFGAWPAFPSDAAAVSIFRSGPTSVSDIAVVIKSLWRLWQATQDGYSSLLSLADTSANVYGVRDCYSADKSVLAVCRVYGPSTRAVAVVTAPSVFGNVFRHNFAIDMTGKMNLTELSVGMSTAVYNATTRPWYQNAVSNGIGVTAWFLSSGTTVPIRSFSVPVWDSLGVNMLGVMSSDEALMSRMPVYNKCLRNSYAPTTARLLATVAASTLPSRQTTWAQFSAIVTQLTSVYFSSDTGYGVSTGMSTPTGDYFGLRDCRAPSNAMDAICRVVIAQGHSILAELVSQPYFGDMKRHAYIVDDVTGLLSSTSVGMYPSDFIPASQPWYMQAVSMGQGWSGYYPFVDSSVVGITYAIPVYNSSGNLVSVISADYTNQEPCYDPLAWNSYTITASSAGASKFGAWPASPSDAAAVSIFRSGPTSVSDIAVVIKSLWSTWQSTQQGDSRLITLADTSANSYGVRDCYSADNALLSVCRVYGPSARALAIVTSPSVFGNVYRHNFMIDIAGNMNMTELALGMSTAVYNATTRPWYQNAVLYGTGLSPWYSSAATAAPIRSFSVPVWDSLGVNMLGVVSSDEALAVRLPVYNKCLRNSYAPTTARLLAAVAASALPSRQTTWSQFSAIVTQLTSVYFSSDTGYGVSTGMSTPTGDFFGLRDCRAPSNAMDAICRVVIAQGHSILAELVSQPYFGDMKRHAYIVDDVTGLLSTTSVGIYPSDFIPASQPWYMQAVSMGQGWSGYYPFVDSSVVGITYAIPVYNSSGNLVSVISADYTNQEPCYDPLAWNSYIISASTSGASKFGAWPAFPSDAAAVSIFRSGPTSVSDIAVVIKSLWRLWQATQDGYSSLLSLADTSANVYGVRDCYSADKSVLAVCRVYGPSTRAVAVVTAPSVFGNVFRHNFAIDMTGKMNLTELSVGMSTAVYNATTRPWYQNAVSNGIGVTAWFLSSGTTIPIRSFSVPVWDSLGVNMLGVMSSDEALMARMPVYNKCLRNSYAPTTARLLATVAASALPSRQTTWSQFSAIVTQLTSVYFSSDTGYGVSTGMSTPTGDYFGLRDCRAPSNAMDAICRVVIAQGHSILAELVSQPYFGDMKRHAYIVDDVTGLLSTTSVGMYPSDFIPASQPWYMQAVSMGQGWSGYYPFVDSSVVGITYAIPVYNSSGNLVSVISADYTNQEPCYDPLAWNSRISFIGPTAAQLGDPRDLVSLRLSIATLASEWGSMFDGKGILTSYTNTSFIGIVNCLSPAAINLPHCLVLPEDAALAAVVQSTSLFGDSLFHTFGVWNDLSVSFQDLGAFNSAVNQLFVVAPAITNGATVQVSVNQLNTGVSNVDGATFSMSSWYGPTGDGVGGVGSATTDINDQPHSDACMRYSPAVRAVTATLQSLYGNASALQGSSLSSLVQGVRQVFLAVSSLSSFTTLSVTSGNGASYSLWSCTQLNVTNGRLPACGMSGSAYVASLSSSSAFNTTETYWYPVTMTGMVNLQTLIWTSTGSNAQAPSWSMDASMGVYWSPWTYLFNSTSPFRSFTQPIYNASTGQLLGAVSSAFSSIDPCFIPIPCVLGAWSPPSSCDAACGTGASITSRAVLQRPTAFGYMCPTLINYTSCNIQACAVPAGSYVSVSFFVSLLTVTNFTAEVRTQIRAAYASVLAVNISEVLIISIEDVPTGGASVSIAVSAPCTSLAIEAANSFTTAPTGLAALLQDISGVDVAVSGSVHVFQPPTDSSPAGKIVGGVIGGLILLAVVVLTVRWMCRRRNRRRSLAGHSMGKKVSRIGEMVELVTPKRVSFRDSLTAPPRQGSTRESMNAAGIYPQPSNSRLVTQNSVLRMSQTSVSQPHEGDLTPETARRVVNPLHMPAASV
jgi:hypothetical protein